MTTVEPFAWSAPPGGFSLETVPAAPVDPVSGTTCGLRWWLLSVCDAICWDMPTTLGTVTGRLALR